MKINLIYLLKQAWHQKKMIYPLFVLDSVVKVARNILSLLFFRLIIGQILVNKYPNVFMFKAACYFIAVIVACYLAEYLDGLVYSEVMGLRNTFLSKFTDVCMTMSYENTENSENLNKMKLAFQAVSNNSSGIEGVYHKLGDVITNLVSLIAYGFIISKISIFACLALMIGGIAGVILVLQAEKYEDSIREKEMYNKRHIAELINIMTDYNYGKDIRIYDAKRILFQKIGKYKASYVKIRKKVEFKYCLYRCLQSLIQIISVVGTIVFLIFSIKNKKYGVESFIVFYQSIIMINPTIKSMFENIIDINKQNLVVNNFRLFLYSNKIESNETENAKTEKILKAEDITIKNLSFKYNNSENYVLNDITFSIKAGQKVAIVGENGSGKTTLVNNIMKLYNDYEGDIFYGGRNIIDINRAEYFDLFSPMFQENIEMAFSVEENVACDSPVNSQKVDDAISIIGLKNKITKLPNGVKTNLKKEFTTESVDFSGGEIQKLMFARAYYKNAPIYILDEPTSNLDPIAEKNFYESVCEKLSDKTVIYVTHRLLSTKMCDKIICLDKGKVVEIGSHQELINKNGYYSKMFNLQASYYRK